MVSLEHLKGERTQSVLTPGIKLFPVCFFILTTAKGCDRTAKGVIFVINVRFINGEVGAENRQIHLHKISTLHYCLWCAGITTKFLDKLLFR